MVREIFWENARRSNRQNRHSAISTQCVGNVGSTFWHSTKNFHSPPLRRALHAETSRQPSTGTARDAEEATGYEKPMMPPTSVAGARPLSLMSKASLFQAGQCPPCTSFLPNPDRSRPQNPTRYAECQGDLLGNGDRPYSWPCRP